MNQNLMDFDIGADKLREECGVFGMYDFDGNDVAQTIYYGLFALQHRGQESCGIAVSDTEGPKGKAAVHKGMGLCNEVFTPEVLEGLRGNIGVGHVRYSTAGSSTRENAQPLVLNYVKGILGLAHNGNLVNAPELRHELEYTGAIFQTTIDSEVIAYHIARARIHTHNVESAVAVAMKKLKGAYSLVIMSPRKLIGARDPMGFKPLCIGKRDNAYILASETCALETIGAEFVRDVEPGEIVTITADGISSDKGMCLSDPSGEARCIFEYIYFARPDSVFDGVSVYKGGIRLAAHTGPDSLYLVGCQGDAHTGAADSDSQVSLTVSHGPAYLFPVYGVVAALGGIGSQVNDLIALSFHKLPDYVLKLNGCMVVTNCNFHNSSSPFIESLCYVIPCPGQRKPAPGPAGMSWTEAACRPPSMQPWLPPPLRPLAR